MKQFIKYVLATVAGIIIVGVLFTFTSIIGLVGIAAMGSSTSTVKENSVLVIQLQGSIDERSEENPFANILGNNTLTSQGLDDILEAIKRAKEDDKVKGIYIEAGTFAGAMPATLQSIRNALVDFKKEKKFIVSYGDTYTQGAYYLCSVSDTVIVNPQGMIDWSGLSSNVMYYKDLLEKIGVEMQVVKVGTYKSAVEPFLLNEMSDANREQIETYNGEIWGEMLKAVSKSRGISVAKLNELADSAMLFQETKLYKKEKLVDKIAYSDAIPQTIANMMNLDSPDDYHTLTVSDLASAAASKPKGTSGNIIAVYYAVGGIVDEAASGFSQEPEIVGKTVAKDLQELADDDDVKAVVLRVNSGGGSAYASEQIWHQVMNIKTNKPIVVSMGDMAASGGYYISCAANYIFAEPTTITGSIGIFGMFPNAGTLLNDKLGIHFSTVKTNEMSDFGDISRPFTERERAIAQQYVNRGYDLFTKRCADGRKMKQADIKKIGEGRVWTGLHAKQLGLVDELGGLDQAIEKAKHLAKIDDASVLSYPAKSSIFDNLLNEANGSSYADTQLKQALGEYYNIFSDIKNIHQRTGIQANLPYFLMFNL
ncbi:MAG: signal peptide peptidase SppA [Prevotellaceae bacterium]|nr:signal peptide peptidase SppA [Prevotellaceae bacterium]